MLNQLRESVQVAKYLIFVQEKEGPEYPCFSDGPHFRPYKIKCSVHSKSKKLRYIKCKNFFPPSCLLGPPVYLALESKVY